MKKAVLILLLASSLLSCKKEYFKAVVNVPEQTDFYLDGNFKDRIKTSSKTFSVLAGKHTFKFVSAINTANKYEITKRVNDDLIINVKY